MRWANLLIDCEVKSQAEQEWQSERMSSLSYSEEQLKHVNSWRDAAELAKDLNPQSIEGADLPFVPKKRQQPKDIERSVAFVGCDDESLDGQADGFTFRFGKGDVDKVD